MTYPAPPPPPKKSANPWMIIGWIILGLMVLPCVGCGAIAAIGAMAGSSSTSTTIHIPK